MIGTRSHRTPWSIWIAVGLCLLFAASKTVLVIKLLASSAPFDSLRIAFSAQGFATIFALYLAMALARLSRWPVLLALAMTILSQIAFMLIMRQPASLLGLLLNWGPIVIYAVCTLPHWRKMNWALFGRPYRPPEDQIEVFA